MRDSFEVCPEVRAWDNALSSFQDASIYQTEAYGAANWPPKKLEFCILRRDTDVIAAAQVRLLALPVFGTRIAYVPWGPVWRRIGAQVDYSIFQTMISCLSEEYVRKRRCYLRLAPNVYTIDQTAQEVLALLRDSGFSGKPAGRSTLLLPLEASEDQLMAAQRRTWRACLRHGLEESTVVQEDSSEDSVRTALCIYDEMSRRKRFAEFAPVHSYVSVHRRLPSTLQLHTIICYHANLPVCAIVWSHIGVIGLPVIAATSSRALEINASHVAWWRMVQHMKAMGLLWCDLGGVNKSRNVGGYIFKTGLAGKLGVPADYLGVFERCDSAIVRRLAHFGEKAREVARRVQMILER